MLRHKGYIVLIEVAQPLRAGDIKRGPDHDGAVKIRIMYIECKHNTMTGEARIGRVTFSRSGRTLYYGDQELRHLPYPGYDNSNHYDVATGEDHWVSGPKKDGGDRRYSARVPVHVDADVRAEYWTSIRSLPHRATDEDASH